MKPRSFTALVQRDGDIWSSHCPELEVASQGTTVEEAKANLREAIELFFETASPDQVADRLKAEVFLSSLEVQLG